MMKKIYPLILVTLLYSACSVKQPDAKELMKNVKARCNAVQNGYYEMTRYMKYMSEKDTAVSASHCSFVKSKGDTLFGMHFQLQSFDNSAYSGEALYNGEDLVIATLNDSTASVLSKKKWPNDIADHRHYFNFYSLITAGELFGKQDKDCFNDSTCTFKMLGEEQLNNRPVYHIQVNKPAKKEAGSPETVLRDESHYWIDKSDLLPIQYSWAFDMVMDKDTMRQYEKMTLDKWDFDHLKGDSKKFAATGLPALYRLKDYVPFVEPKPLPQDTIAPGWELPALDDKKVNLKDLKGQLVLVDFFYKSCYPCMLALPELQALHEKYKDKGLRVIGINPYDTKAGGIATFLSARGVTYTVLLNGKEVAANYRVYGYPTMFLISKTGKITYMEVGYGEGSKEELEKIIIKNL